ncbi:MAG TPA: hypothetical protein VF763_08245 [Candidatus Limnocylindrales bacterium]
MLLLKLALTPALIGLATLVARRWGPAAGGWLVGLPLTSGPVSFFLASDHGTGFAVSAARGSLVGGAAEAGFCLGYLALARAGWPAAVAAGSLGFVAASAAIQPAAGLVLPAELVVVVAVLGGTLLLVPDGDAGGPATVSPPWDLPARMIVGVALVLGLTTLAPALGAQATGILAAFPVYAAVLAGFAHRLEGPAAARSVLHGLLVGLFAFGAFFAVIEAVLVPLGVGPAFALAVAAALLVQGATFLVRRARGGAAKAAVPVIGT